MEYIERQYYLSKIIKSSYKFKLFGMRFKVNRPHPDVVCESEEVYMNTYKKSLQKQLFTEHSIKQFLIDNDFWTYQNEERLNLLNESIPQYLKNIFNYREKPKELEFWRKQLNSGRSEINELNNKLNIFYHLTVECVSRMAQRRYLLYHSMTPKNSAPKILDTILNKLSQNYLKEDIIREIARTDPWISLQTFSKYTSRPFAFNPICLNDNQRVLLMWHEIYQNTLKNSELPSPAIINDDDIFDGWILVTKAKREIEQDRKDVQSLLDPRIAKHEDIFIVANSSEQAKKIDNMNSLQSKMNKKMKLDMVKKHGIVREIDMPDTQLKLQRAQVEAFKKFAHKGK
jgi:hypothetical protein